MLTLRPYQEAAVAAVYEHLAARDDNPCVVMPTGSGKAICLARICADVVQRWNSRVLVLTHVRELVDQNATQASRFLSPLLVGVHSAGLKRRDLDHPVIVAGIQSVYRRATDLGRFDVAIVDECFPAGTLIDTPHGMQAIEDILPGDDVLCATGIGQVQTVSVKANGQLIRVEFEDGTSLTCTPNHPIFTDAGWIPAGSLAVGAHTFGREELCRLWKALPALGSYKCGWISGRDAGDDLAKAATLLDILCADIPESHGVTSHPQGGSGDTQADAVEADPTLWQWQVAATAAACLASCPRTRLGTGVDCSNQKGQGIGFPVPLQNRHSPPTGTYRNRGGWSQPSEHLAKAGGSKEEPLIGGKRVVGAAPIECESPRLVFNLQVDRHPSYFADGVLVHNCHLISPDGEGMYRTFLADAKTINPHVRLIGLTATPFRLKDGPICAPGNLLNHVCYEIGVKDLIRDGFLSPLVAKAGKARADTGGLHLRAGEFVADEVEALMDQDALVGAACAEIADLTRDRRACLIFAAGIQHAEHVARVLRESHGLDTACVFGHTPDAERDRIVARFKRGELRHLVNVAVLTTGFDAPQIDCVVLLRPTMSAGLYAQQVGRGFRLAPGKRDCLVLDYGGNVLRHGPVDALKISEPGSGKSGEAPAKECPQCQALIATGCATCPQCGHAFPPPQREQHEAQASTAGVLSGQVTTTEHAVRSVFYTVHRKHGAGDEAPQTLRVEYEIGWNRWLKEWVCIEHTGYARTKALAWWRARSDLPMPPTARAACLLADANALAEPTHITVRSVAGEEFERIVDSKLGPKPAREPGTDEGEASEAIPAMEGIVDDDAPPF